MNFALQSQDCSEIGPLERNHRIRQEMWQSNCQTKLGEHEEDQ
jgi:hypothetical protein